MLSTKPNWLDWLSAAPQAGALTCNNANKNFGYLLDLKAKQESKCLEMIQKKAFGIILGSKFKNYTNALEILEQEALLSRRLKLCEHFAIKCVNNPKHVDLFPTHTGPKTRHTQNIHKA